MRLPRARRVDADIRSRSRGALKMPPILSIIALATFAASLPARALGPVLPHVAEDFSAGIGPIAYGSGILNPGKKPTMLASAVVIIAFGILCARLLRHTIPADAT
jgi:hypothetical protein